MRWLSDDELIQSVLSTYEARVPKYDTASAMLVAKLKQNRDSCCFVSTFWDGDYLNGAVVRSIMLLLGTNISSVWVKSDPPTADYGRERVDQCGTVHLPD